MYEWTPSRTNNIRLLTWTVSDACDTLFYMMIAYYAVNRSVYDVFSSEKRARFFSYSAKEIIFELISVPIDNTDCRNLLNYINLLNLFFHQQIHCFSFNRFFSFHFQQTPMDKCVINVRLLSVCIRTTKPAFVMHAY